MNRLSQWVLLDGNRLLVAGLIVLGTLVLTSVLIGTGAIAVGPSSSVATLFGSGITSGVFTLLTVALSVNQLILSRVFGTPEGLTDRLDGAFDFRHTVEDAANEPSSPNAPADFLALTAETLTERTEALDDAITGQQQDLRDEFDPYIDDVLTHADHVSNAEESQSTHEIVSALLGPEYAQLMTATDRLQSKYGDQLSEQQQTHLETILELLKSIAVSRQFFKTIAIQQNLARLSLLLVYFGIPSLLVAFVVTLLYTSDPSTPIALRYLPIIISLALAAIVAPLAVLVAYILRLATITRYTVSVGPFIPPEERA